MQQYGAHYNHKAAVVEKVQQNPWPTWCTELGNLVVCSGHLHVTPEQAIINEYLPGQGIASHIDHPDGFGPIVVSITLGSGVTLDLSNADSGAKWHLYLEVGSLVVLSGASRFEWKHGIAKRDFDIVNNCKVPRDRRVSVTFRTLSSP